MYVGSKSVVSTTEGIDNQSVMTFNLGIETTYRDLFSFSNFLQQTNSSTECSPRRLES